MSNIDPHQLVTCPYNPAHQIEHYRLHFHLQKSHPEHKPSERMATCPFDATHVVNEMELDYHVTQCPKRVLFDNETYVMDNGFVAPFVEVEQPPSPPPPIFPEECWDEDNVTSYMPDTSKQGDHIIKKIKGATPSERRKARMEGVKTYRPKE